MLETLKPLTQEELEALTNELIDAIWPALDRGSSKDEIRACVNNALDSWEPKPPEEPK